MERKGTFLRAKLAKRIFVLFLAGALVPVTALALLSYHRLHGYMREQGTETLRYSAKEAGLAMLDRLRMAEIELALVADRLVRGVNVSLATEPAALDAPPRLGSIWQVGGATERILAGDPIEAPELSKEQLEHLAAGETALVIGYEPNNSVLLVRAMAQGRLERGTIWAEVNPPFLWASESTQLASSVVCVFNSVSTPLLCPPGVSNELWIRVSRMSSSLSNPGFEWEYGDFEYVSAVWQLFLAYDYEAPNWFVTWSQPKSAAFASITAFRTEMGLVFLLTLTLVFLIANVQVRTNLDPVVQLTAATRRVAAGDLEARVDIQSEDEFQELAESFNAMGSRLGQQFAMLETMSEIDRAVLSAMETGAVVREFLTRSTVALGCNSASVVILSPDSEPSRRFSVGANGEMEQDNVVPTEHEIDALREVPDGLKIGARAAARLSYVQPSRSRADGDALWRVLPILLGGEPVGMVVLEYAGGEARELRGAHARNLTDQLGVAISNARLVERLDQLSWGTLAALARTMDAKSSWTAGHSERVTELAISLGRRLDLSREDIDLLHRGSMLHDIGKVVVPVTILDKPGPLTEEEREEIRRHVEVGASILEPIPAHADTIPIVLHHHERFDGTGYPHGLAGSEIPLLVRIVSLADVFDALVSPRPYRDALASAEARAVIRSEAGRQFDPELVPVFLEMIEAMEETEWEQAV